MPLQTLSLNVTGSSSCGPTRPADVLFGTLERSYEELSFSGGGLRCFWQGGAVAALGAVLPLSPKRIAAASGGALSAACFVAGTGDRLIDVFSDRLERHDRNVRLSAAAKDECALTPHQAIYEDVVSAVLDKKACTAVADGPAMEILLARPPVWAPGRAGAALTMMLYEIDKRIRSTPHGRLAPMAGARIVRVDARKAARDGRLVELVCKAATIPPIFRMKDWDGAPIIDAGTLENAPLPSDGSGRTLVLLTRSYRNLPEKPGRTYVFPSRATPADKIDFTDADALAKTYDQGKADMEWLLREAPPG